MGIVREERTPGRSAPAKDTVEAGFGPRRELRR